MKTPTLPYASVGVVVGGILNFVVTGGSTRMSDLLTGAIFGLVIGVVLAITKYKILDRK